jgi:hypothetical protein
MVRSPVLARQVGAFGPCRRFAPEFEPIGRPRLLPDQHYILRTQAPISIATQIEGYDLACVQIFARRQCDRFRAAEDFLAQCDDLLCLDLPIASPLRLNTARAGRFGASVQSTRGFDRLMPYTESDCRCPRCSRRRSWPSRPLGIWGMSVEVGQNGI